MRFLSACLCLGILLCTSMSYAEDAESNSIEINVDYLERMIEGHRLFANNQHEAAQRSYESALEAQRDDALATYLVACCQRARGQFDEALSTFQSASSLAAEDDRLKAHCLMNIAFVQESRREFEAAREAWNAYISFAESHQNVPTYVENARQRLSTITAIEELDAAYEPVRQRIAERAAQNESSNQE